MVHLIFIAQLGHNMLAEKLEGLAHVQKQYALTYVMSNNAATALYTNQMLSWGLPIFLLGGKKAQLSDPDVLHGDMQEAWARSGETSENLIQSLKENSAALYE